MRNSPLPILELTLQEKHEIGVAVDSLGPRPVAELLGISRLALANALCRELTSARGTIAIIRQNIHKLKDK